ncbi:MAG: DUF1667 domain-containing protein [Peptoniphilaceae bacterium]|nr:DUF1667 domain-containing protein [Peptoniphilaceae bacterium]MDY6019021.1 DUF1667 domain-containing protein [Anaerococcus sp.]
MEKKMYCINCPNGCLLTVNYGEDKKILSVEGNLCPKGISYAEDEIKDPKRMLTSVVSVEGSDRPMLAVISDGALPKRSLEEAVRSLREIHVKAPIKAGDLIVKDILGTGVNIVAAQSLNV